MNKILYKNYCTNTKSNMDNNNNSILPAIILGSAIGISAIGLTNHLLYFPEPAKLIYNKGINNEVIKDLLGEPIDRSVFWEGYVRDFEASISIPIEGPKGKGTLSSRLVRDDKNGEWEPLMLLFRQNNTMINLKEPLKPLFSKKPESIQL